MQGIGAVVLNTQRYRSSKPIVNGVGAGCGQYWHLQPQTNVYPSNGKNVGAPIVVNVNDQCPDAGYCQQSDQTPLNDYDTMLHFDLVSIYSESTIPNPSELMSFETYLTAPTSISKRVVLTRNLIVRRNWGRGSIFW